MKYFLTGATGFVGSVLATRLLREGHSVHALVRDPATAGGLLAQGALLFKGDVTDRTTLISGIQGVDGVFHVAGYYKLGSRDRAQNERVNVNGTRNVLETMRDLGIRRGVYTSTLAVFSDTHGQVADERYKYHGIHITEYDRTKWVAHYKIAEPLMESGLPLVIVLPGLIYGPKDSSLLHDTWDSYLRGMLIAVPSQTAYCWSHVDDVVHGHMRAMEAGRIGESYIIAGPPHTLVEALTVASSMTGIPVPRIRPGRNMMLAGAAVAKQIEKLIPVPGLYSSEGLRATAAVTYLGSNARARRDLGYSPRSLDLGLPPTLRWEVDRIERQGGHSKARFVPS